MDLRRLAVRPLLAYYLGGTPLFFLLDVVWDVSVRASFLDDLPARVAYYAVCLACGLVVWRSPGWGGLVGLAESVANLTLLVVGFMAPILSLPAALAGDPYAAIAGPTPESITNFALAAGVAWWTLQRRTAAALRS